MKNEDVVAYAQEAKQFFDEYVAFLNRTALQLRNVTRTDADYYFYVLTQTALSNAEREQVRIQEHIGDLPLVIRSYSISDFFWSLWRMIEFILYCLNVRDKSQNQEAARPVLEAQLPLQPKSQDALIKITRYLQRAQEMLQTQYANSPENEVIRKDLVALQASCDGILMKYRTEGETLRKSWLNGALRIRGAAPRIRVACAGLRDMQTNNKATIQLKRLAMQLNNEISQQDKVLTTRATSQRVTSEGEFMEHGYGAVQYGYTHKVAQLKGSLRGFVEYASKNENPDSNQVLYTVRGL